MLQAAWTCLCNLRTGLCDLCVSVCTQRRVAIPQASRTDTAGRFLENEKYPPSRQKSTKNETKRPGSHLEPLGGLKGGPGGPRRLGPGPARFSSFVLVSPGVPPRGSLLDSPRFSSFLLWALPAPKNPTRQALDPAELQNPPQSQFWAKLRPKEKNTENREIKEITGILRKWAAFPRGRIAVLVVKVEVEVVVQQCIVH